MKRKILELMFKELVNKGKAAFNARILQLLILYPELAPKLKNFQEQFETLKEVTVENVQALWKRVSEEPDARPTAKVENPLEELNQKFKEMLGEKGPNFERIFNDIKEKAEPAVPSNVADNIKSFLEKLGLDVELIHVGEEPYPSNIQIDTVSEIDTLQHFASVVDALGYNDVRYNEANKTLMLNVAGTNEDQITVKTIDDVIEIEANNPDFNLYYEYKYRITNFDVQKIALNNGILEIKFMQAQPKVVSYLV